MSAHDLSVTAHIRTRPVCNSSHQHTTCQLQLTSSHDLSVTAHVNKRPFSKSCQQHTTCQ